MNGSEIQVASPWADFSEANKVFSFTAEAELETWLIAAV